MTALHRRTTPLLRQLALFAVIIGFLVLVCVTFPTGARRNHTDGVVIPPGQVGVYENYAPVPNEANPTP